MKRLFLCLLSSVLLLPALGAPAYDSDDLQLEGMLAPFKDSAESGDPVAMRQVYLHYGMAGKQDQAQAWVQKFLDTLRDRAEAGEVKAMTELGRAYLAGDACLTPDPLQASAWLNRASDAGDATAAYMLGEMFKQQQNTAQAEQAYARAYGLFRHQADKGDLTARYWQGFMELRGIGTPLPQEPAATLSELMRAHDFVPAAYQLFKYAAEQEDEDLTYTCARLLADKGQDPQMAYVVADAAFKGKGCEQDEELAERYLEQAVSAAVPEALYHRAWMKEADAPAEAFRLFSDAAAGGHAEALVKAGVMLLEGRGTEADEATGLHYLQQAEALYRSPFAAWELMRYYDERGERALADEHAVAASDRGLAQAMARRGLLHLLPASCVEWSPTEAYRWWQRGANAEEPTCVLYLRLYLYFFIPLLVIAVFAAPMLLARHLLRRDTPTENAAK